jgi:uncharacterized protein YlxW (UPF0749 family)
VSGVRLPLRSRRVTAWSALVPVVALAAGLLFATSGQTAQGSDLRAGDTTQLSALIQQRDEDLRRRQAELADLQAQVQQLTAQAGSRNGAVKQAEDQAGAAALSAGLTPLSGPGVTITLDDAPRRPDGSLPAGARPDDVVIHQSDVQAVVNALWAAGADGVAVMGQRLITTSAVRCVGNVLLLQGRTYSPPFVVTAVVDASAVRPELDASPQVQVFQDAVDAFGLTFDVEKNARVDLPAYDGSLDMRYAEAG